LSASDRYETTGLAGEWTPAELRSICIDALKRSSPDEAETACRALLGLEPNDIYALVGLGKAASLRGEREEALRRFREAAKAWPSHAWPLLELGGELVALGRIDEAEATLRRGLELGPNNFHILMALGRLLRRRGANENAYAAELFLRATKCEPTEPVAHDELAAVLIDLGRLADAIAAYGAVVDDTRIATVKRRNAALAAGRLARNKNDRPTALLFFEQAAALDAEDFPTNCELGQLSLMLGRFKEAETSYRRAVALAPTDVGALAGLALALRRLGNIDEALEYFTKANVLAPKNAWIQHEFALCLRDAGRLDEAEAMMESIDRASDFYAEARVSLGHLARSRGERRRAVEYFKQAAEAASDSTSALYYIALETSALGEWSEARQAITDLFERNPKSYLGHMADGVLKRAMNDHAGAQAAYYRAAAIKPAEAQPLVEIATEASALGDANAANASIDAALKIDPRHEEALLKRAAFSAKSGDVDAALSTYAQLRDQRPHSVLAYLQSSELLAEKGRFDDGLAVLAKAREFCPLNSQIDFCEAAILRKQGLLDENYEALSAANVRFPLEFWPWNSQTAAAIDLGYYSVAKARLDAPPQIAVREQGPFLKLRARFDKSRWALDEAIEALGGAIDVDAKDAEAIYERAKLKLITFDIEGAWLDLVAYAQLRSARSRRIANPLLTHVGQLYEEYVIDSDLAAELGALRELTPEERLQQLAELVRRFPDSTAPAIGMMIALRQAGRFELPPASNDVHRNAQRRIPWLITQYWDDPEPPTDVQSFMNSWKKSDPGCRIEIFHKSSALAYLRRHFGSAVGQSFSRAREPAQQADIFRLARLFREGGFFVDADDRARGGLTAQVPPHAEIFAHQEDLGSIGNNVLGAAPGHPVIEMALRDAVAAVQRGDRDLIWLSTGPALLTRSLARWFTADRERVEARVGAVTILTLAEMRQVAAIHCHAAYKSTTRAWLNAAFAKGDHP
jgi:tetratricopeptide (TPR) repeat protein